MSTLAQRLADLINQAGSDHKNLRNARQVVQLLGPQANVSIPFPAHAKFAYVKGWSGGQGGASGRRGAAASTRGGGAGGAGGGYFEDWFSLDELRAAGLTGFYGDVGGGGVGAAAQTVDSTNGINGTQGGDTFLKSSNAVASISNTLCEALSTGVSSTVPVGGSTANVAGGVGGFGKMPGLSGGTGSSGAAINPPLTSPGYKCAGGGGGGAINSVNTSLTGAMGAWVYGRGLFLPANTPVDTIGADGVQPPGFAPGGGGCGGGAPTGGAAGKKGGKGGYGAGGGGGSASLNGANSGAGGDGGPGGLEVIFI